jgi:hypothetical protein
MSSAATHHEADILSRVLSPTQPNLSSPLAKMILEFDFPSEDRERMNELADKARDGSLTGEEQAEIDACERVGHFLSLLRSKARISLEKSPPNSG